MIWLKTEMTNKEVLAIREATVERKVKGVEV